MGAHALTGQQVGVNGLGEQGVPEHVAVLGGAQDLGVDGRAQRLLQLLFGGPGATGHGGQQGVRDPTPGGGDQAEDATGGFGEGLDRGQEQVAGTVGKRRPGRVVAVQQGLDEQGVAAAAFPEQVQVGGVEACSAQRGGLRVDLITRERFHVQAADPGQAL